MKLRVMKGIIAFALCTSMVLSNINYIGASLSENATTDTNEITIDKNIDESTEGNTEENNGLITGGAAAVVDSSDSKIISENIVPLVPTITTSENEIEKEEVITEDVVLETEVNGIRITLFGSSQAIPEGSELQATELEPQTVETEIVEEALDQEEKEKKVKIQKYRAFDIKIMNGGSEIQPGENVKLAFSGDLLVPEGEEVIDVYHVNDADATVTSVKEEGGNDEVIAVTDSFSTYVLVIKEAINSYTVTTKYYLTKNGTTKQIYRPTETEIKISESNDIYTVSCNDIKDEDKIVYQLNKVIVKDTEGTLNQEVKNTSEPYQLINDKSKDLIVEMYYLENANEFSSPVTFFDYDVWGTENNDGAIETWNWYVFDSFKKGSNTYRNYVLRYSGNDCYLAKDNNANKVPNASGQIKLKNGDKLTNVKHGDDTYASLTYNSETRKFYGKSQTEKTRKNAGINSTGKNITNGTYLSIGQTGSEYSYTLPMEKDVMVGGRMQYGRDLDANYNNVEGGHYINEGYDAIVPGLVHSLSGNNYETLNMGVNKNGDSIVEPGLFSNEPVTGKTIYSDDDFKLNFQQIGNRYVLLNAEETATNKRTTAATLNNQYEKTNVSRDFFPLNGVESDINPDDNKSENWYFGMRYDFDFSLEDYVGPLSYTFEGDDDLWVFLDGQLVLDLGGMHSTYPGTYKETPEENTVDLWKYIIDPLVDTSKDDWWDSLSESQKAKYEEARTKTHQVTVLYMERGGYDSSCYMDFVIPNVSERTPVITTTPKINIEFDKVDAIDASKMVKGAKFSLVSNDDNTKQYTAFSDEKGKVSFKGIKTGTYTLSEIYAPDGYILSNKKWQVKVSGSTPESMKYEIFKLNNQGKLILPAIYDSATAGDNRLEIENMPILDYDVKGTKTAQVISWDDRTYNIMLGAYHTTQLQQETDVVLVLDCSASMTWITSQDAEAAGLKNYNALTNAQKNMLMNACEKSKIFGQSGWDYKYYAKNKNNEYQPIYYENGNWYYVAANGTGGKGQDDYAFSLGEYLEVSNGTPMTKLETLQKSVRDYLTNFRNAAQQLSENDSEVAVVAFSNQASILMNHTEVANLTDAQIEACVNGLETKITGGTRQDLGLEQASGILENMSEDNDQYTILFTDGKPNGADVSVVTAKASDIKNKNTQIYSVGICSGNDTENTTIKEVLNSCASDSDKVYFSENAEGLMAAFGSIWSLFSGEQKANIVDYIDSRFELTEETKRVIEDNSGVISTDSNGVTYITWSNQNIAYGSVENPVWSRSFTVRAKAEYAGGNDIPTNGNGSGITPEGGSKIEFPKPTVNVKVQFNLPDAKEVFFLGEQIGDVYKTPTDFLTLFNLKMDTNNEVLTQLTYQTESDTKTYTNLQDVSVKITGTVGTDTGKLKDMLNKILGDKPKESKTFYEDILKTTVYPNNKGVKSATAMVYEGVVTNGRDEKGNPLFQQDNKWYYAVPVEMTESADITAYVVDGKVDITKEIDRYYEKAGVSQYIIDNQTFIFKIERFEVNTDGTVGEKDSDFGDVYETISFKNGDEKIKTKSLIGLERGYYKVTEETEWSWKYMNSKTKINDNDNQEYLLIGERITKENEKVDFVGLDIEKRSYGNAGKYQKLISDTTSQEYRDMVDLVDIKNANERKSIFYFWNIFDEKKKRILGDVSVMTNDFK